MAARTRDCDGAGGVFGVETEIAHSLPSAGVGEVVGAPLLELAASHQATQK